MKISGKNINWLAVAAMFTVSYALWLTYTLGWSRLTEFLSSEQKLNEVGDFLAGAFAPIALIWLVAAVLTQRQELTETRDQFAKNQKIVDEQLKTIRSQNALLALQHNQAVENAKQAYKLNLFDKRMRIYQKLADFGDTHNGRYDDDDYWTIINLAHEAAFVFDTSIEQWLSDIAQQIYDFVEFKRGKEFQTVDDGYGGIIQPNNAHNEALRRQFEEYTGWIDEQFLPETRSEKFWSFMRVTDAP